LIRLAQELGDCQDADAVLSALERGVRQSLRPTRTAFSLPDAPPLKEVVLRIPVRRGEVLRGYLDLGPKENGEPYSGEERELLEAAGVQAAVALENARLN